MIAEMDDIAFLTVRRWQAIAHFIENAIGDGIFLGNDGCRFQPGHDVCFPLTAKKGTVFVRQRLFCAILTTYVILTNLG